MKFFRTNTYETIRKNLGIFDGKTKTQSKPLNLTQAQALILNLLKQKSTNIYLWTPGWNEWLEMNMVLESEQDFFVLPPSFRNKIDDKTQLITEIQNNKTETTNPNILSDQAIKDFNNLPNSFTDASNETITKKVDYGYFFPDFKAENIDLNINKLEKKVSLAPPVDSTIGNISSVSSDRRDRVRFNFRLEILLVTKNGKTFKSESDNISIGGIKLIDKIPKEFLYLDFNLIIVNKLEKDPKYSRIHFNTKCVGDITDPCRLVFVNPDKKNKELLEKLINSYIKQAKTA